MPYLVIDADQAIVSGGMVATQTAADTLAATNSEWTAHQGDVTGADFHANTEPGWFLTSAGVTVRELPLTPLRELKNVMSEAHHYLIEVQEQLHIEGSGRPWSEVILVHDYLARVHQSNYRIVKENPQPLSVADRTRYATALLAGPQDASHVLLSVSGLFDAITDPLTVLNAQGVTYVNPVSGDQITIQNSVHTNLEQSRELWGLGTVNDPLMVSEAQLISGLWTEGITI